jgi:hypothetical protein
MENQREHEAGTVVQEQQGREERQDGSIVDPPIDMRQRNIATIAAVLRDEDPVYVAALRREIEKHAAGTEDRDEPAERPAGGSAPKAPMSEREGIDAMMRVLRGHPSMRDELLQRLQEAEPCKSPGHRAAGILEILTKARAHQLVSRQAAEDPFDALTQLVQTLDEAQRRDLVNGLTAAAVDEPEPDPPAAPRFTLAKAKSDFVPVAKWLLARGFTERLAAVASHILLTHEDSLGENGAYADGSAGNDLLHDWEREISEAVARPPESVKDDPETMLVAAYLMGRQTGAN